MSVHTDVADAEASPGARTLLDLGQGEQCLVTGFGPELDDAYRVRLMELGFHPGEIVYCVQAPGLGAPRLYRVQNTIYSLDDLITRFVIVSTVQ